MKIRLALILAVGLPMALPAFADDRVAQAMRKVDPCEKNHYILECQDSHDPLTTVIGKVGAVTTDRRGNVYFSAPHTVWRLAPDGALMRVAGNGTPGFSGDGGPGFLAQLDIPYDTYPEIVQDTIDFSPLIAGLAVDADDNLFIADAYNNRIRKVTPRGVISSVAASDAARLVYENLNWPQGLAFDRDGHLLASTAWGNILRLNDDGTWVAIAYANCGPRFAEPGICVPTQIAVDTEGNVFVPDGYCRVRRVGVLGSIATVVGNEAPDGHGGASSCGYAPDGTRALGASISWSYAVAISPAGELHFADTYNHCIRKVDGDGLLRTVAGVCVRLYDGSYGGDGGAALDARLNRPSGIAFDVDGNLYIADTENLRVRKVDTRGIITTVAGAWWPPN